MAVVRHYRGLLILLALCLTAAEPIEMLGKIPLAGLKGRIEHLAVDLYHGRLFAAAYGNNSVEVLDAKSNTALQSITGIGVPQDVAYVKSSNRLFVSSGGDGSVRLYDGTTLKPLGSTRLGTDANGIRVDVARKRVYVGYGTGALAVLDDMGKKLADIPLSSHPESFQLAESAERIFVNLPQSHSIAVVSRQTNKVVTEWPLKDAAENFPMALDDAGKRILVVCRRPARLLVLDMDSGALIFRLPCATDAADIFFDPIHSRLYVTAGDGRVLIYAQEDADRYRQIGQINTVSGARTGLFVPEWNRLFVAVRDFGVHPAEIRIYQPR